jgi:hypothetical protein
MRRIVIAVIAAVASAAGVLVGGLRDGNIQNRSYCIRSRQPQ